MKVFVFVLLLWRNMSWDKDNIAGRKGLGVKMIGSTCKENYSALNLFVSYLEWS